MTAAKSDDSRTPSSADAPATDPPREGLLPLDDDIDKLAKKALEVARRAEALERARKDRN